MKNGKNIWKVWQWGLKCKERRIKKDAIWTNANLFVSPSRQSQDHSNFLPIFRCTQVVILYLLIKTNCGNEAFGCCLVWHIKKLWDFFQTNWSYISMGSGHFMVGLAGKSQRLIWCPLAVLSSKTEYLLLFSEMASSSQIRQKLLWN